MWSLKLFWLKLRLYFKIMFFGHNHYVRVLRNCIGYVKFRRSYSAVTIYLNWLYKGTDEGLAHVCQMTTVVYIWLQDAREYWTIFSRKKVCFRVHKILYVRRWQDLERINFRLFFPGWNTWHYSVTLVSSTQSSNILRVISPILPVLPEGYLWVYWMSFPLQY
jgi:hypothetical protein